jgi:hypothetical protein
VLLKTEIFWDVMLCYGVNSYLLTFLRKIVSSSSGSRSVGRGGLLDPEILDCWTLRFWTAGPWGFGLLDPEVLDCWTLRFWTAGPWGFGLLDPEDKDTIIFRNVSIYQSVPRNIQEHFNIPLRLHRMQQGILAHHDAFIPLMVKWIARPGWFCWLLNTAISTAAVM